MYIGNITKINVYRNKCNIDSERVGYDVGGTKS